VNRIALVGTNDLNHQRNNTGATREPGEPRRTGDAGGHSLWWSYYAPVTGHSAHRLRQHGLYSGYPRLQRHQPLAPESRAGGCGLFQAPVPLQYRCRHHLPNRRGWLQRRDGGIGLSLDLLPVPLNDKFANRIGLTGTNLSLTANNRGATHERGEPSHDGLSGAHSLVVLGCAALPNRLCDRDGDGFDPYLCVYTGTNLAKSVTVASNYYGGILQSAGHLLSHQGQTIKSRSIPPMAITGTSRCR